MLTQQIEAILYTNSEFAIFLSILINIIISIAGFIPSVFLTALNIKLFGLSEGIAVSIAGEALGAAAAFFLYRAGFQKLIQHKTADSPHIQRLLHVQGKNAFLLILSFRLLPFVPSSLVTFLAASGKVSWGVFFAASSIGKIPALLLEAYSVNEVLKGTEIGKGILFLLAAGMLNLYAEKTQADK
jgi:uncharacterized membrane protein YdjX (TVP38/TMEM64 family)